MAKFLSIFEVARGIRLKKEKAESGKIQREVNSVEKKCEEKTNKLNVSIVIQYKLGFKMVLAIVQYLFILKIHGIKI